MLIDHNEAASGSLEDDWDFLKPKTIPDPDAKKPEDWDDRAEVSVSQCGIIPPPFAAWPSSLFAVLRAPPQFPIFSFCCRRRLSLVCLPVGYPFAPPYACALAILLTIPAAPPRTTQQIPDPDSKKPDDWDDEPEFIPDPEASKPEDWDDEDDGEWEAPTIANPKHKGAWKPKMMKNPDYKGMLRGALFCACCCCRAMFSFGAFVAAIAQCFFWQSRVYTLLQWRCSVS